MFFSYDEGEMSEASDEDSEEFINKWINPDTEAELIRRKGAGYYA